MNFTGINFIVMMMDVVGKNKVDVHHEEEDDSEGEAKSGHDQPLLQLHVDH